MSKHKKVRYSEEPIGKIEVVSDFLPRPEELIMKEETVKVTISLTKHSVDFFKSEADALHTSYQSMIRNLLEKYASHYQKDNDKNGSA